ncbi:MAG TPA: hypothetical protein VKC17_00990 [Sphingomicrobium sp.]|nr:hypothetical protein [Sphingomicrobium sp.]
MFVLESGIGRSSHFCRGLSGVALLLTGVALSAPANALSTADAAQTSTDPSDQAIIVTAPPLFRDIRPERELDENGIASYGASTIDELLGEVAVDLGDDSDEPLILINGQRVGSLDEIGGLPVEALRNLVVLPRGSAVRAGGTPGQRVISLTLNKRTRAATLTAARKISTDGDWHGSRGEAILTDVRGSTRANLTLRVRDETSLFESDRHIVQPEPSLPYAIGGNVIAYPANLLAEIDPLLSAAAGHMVTVTPVPAAANPTLADFVPNANQAAVTDLGDFRTLRPKTRNYDLNGTFGTRLAPWLTSTATIRLSRSLSRSQRGLPTALFTLAPTNPSSPFSTDVGLAFYGGQPLHSRSQRDGGEANLTLNGTFGKWISNFNARHSDSRDETRSERQNLFGAIPLDDSIDPFGASLSDLIGVHTDRATARSIGNLAQLSFTGPAAKLPAGDLQAVVEGRIADTRLHSRSSFSVLGGDSKFHRSEQAIRIAADVPLTSRDNNFLSQVGNLGANVEYSRIHYSDAGTLNHHALGLTWEPQPLLRLHGDIEETERPASIQTLGNPVIVSPQVRMFDPLTGDTVDVVQITGGNPTLLPEKTKTRRVAGLLRLVPRLNLQLNAEYTDTDARNFVSSLPEASAAVTLAFPERFVRDVNGVLTTVDLRPVNFDSHREKRLRYGLSLSTTIGGPRRAPIRVSAPSTEESADAEAEREPAPPPRPTRSGPPTRLQLSVNHTLVFLDEIRIRPGLNSVDLLEGGAIGIAGGRVRHQLDGTAGLTSGGLGARLGVTWRGPSTLESRIGGLTDTLHFSPLLAVNFRGFVDGARLFGRNSWTHGLRLSLNVLNATNDRQSVRASAGNTPLQYQPDYRDPIGRTVELELRKVF